MTIKNLKGSIVALVTPFNSDGSVNFGKLGELVEFHIENKTDAILTLGTTGESSTMTHEEDNEVCKYVVEKVGGRVPVIAGVGSNCTQTMVEKSQRAEELGADGLLVITPYYNKANEEGIYRHFMETADNVNVPCILYNVPGRTGCSISPYNVSRLCKHENIVAIKEASGDMSYVMNIARYVSDDFALYSGNDDIVVPVLAAGGSGVISVSANIIPRETHDMVHRFFSGDIKGALDIQLKYFDLIKALFCEVNPVPIKEAMNMMGMNIGGYRLPLCEMSEGGKAVLSKALKGVGLI